MHCMAKSSHLLPFSSSSSFFFLFFFFLPLLLSSSSSFFLFFISLSSSSPSFSFAGTRVGPAHPGSRRGVQRGGVQQPEEHAHCTEQQFFQRVPQQQPGGAAQHAGKGAVAPPAQLWRRYQSDYNNSNNIIISDNKSTINPGHHVSPSRL